MDGTLTRDPEDKKRYVLDGVGALRRHGRLSSAATLTAVDGSAWEARRQGWRMRPVFTDPVGGEAARFASSRAFKRGGELVVGSASYSLRPSSRWKERYALARGEQELATIEAGGWSGTRIRVDVEGDVEPLVLLAACWLVRQFADDSASAASAAGAG